MPTARGDRQLGQRLVREFLPGRVQVLPDSPSPDSFIERLQGYDLVIGERLHSLVLSAGCGVPCIGIEYSPKCRDFMESLDMERFCIDHATLSADTLIAAIDEVNSNRADLNRTQRAVQPVSPTAAQRGRGGDQAGLDRRDCVSCARCKRSFLTLTINAPSGCGPAYACGPSFR